VSTSDVEICNLALGRVKVTREIVSLTEGTTEANQCQRFYEHARDNVLRDFAWGFATRYRALALVADSPNTEWRYAYRWPADCLAPRYLVTGVRNDPAPPPFEVGSDATGKLIFTDMGQAMLKYTATITDPVQFAPDFADAVAWRIGTDIAIPLGRSEQDRDHAIKMYGLALSTARTNASAEFQGDPAPEAEAVRDR
jgi:hypothetical protein